MTLGRAEMMYGDKLSPYIISICVLCVGLGWLIAQHARFGVRGVIVRSLGLLVGVYFVDAIVKSIFFIKENFRIKLKLK